MSPRLSPQENEELFGSAASPFGHGHHYRARLTFREDPHFRRAARHSVVNRRTGSQESESRSSRSGRATDHDRKPGRLHFRARRKIISAPASSSARARRFFCRALERRREFSWECEKHSAPRIGCMCRRFRRNRTRSSSESATIRVATATLMWRKQQSAANWINAAARSTASAIFGVPWKRRVGDWDNRHLDLETAEFRDRPSTGENIVQAFGRNWIRASRIVSNVCACGKRPTTVSLYDVTGMKPCRPNE